MDLLLALDMGTTHIKAATFTLDGAVRAHPQPNHFWVRVRHDPHKLESVKELLCRTTSQLGKDDRSFPSVASMGEAGLFLGEDGSRSRPL